MVRSQWLALCLLVMVLVAAIGEVEAAKKKKKKKVLSPEEAKELQGTHFDLLASAIGLQEEHGMSKRPVLNIESESDFYHYIIRSPRRHTLVILFTIENRCAVCRQMDQMFANVASAYEEQLQAETEAGAKLRAAPRLFFIRAPLAGMMGVVEKLGVKTAPSLFVADATNRKGFSTRLEQFLYKPGKETEFSEYEMTRFILERANIRIAGFWPGLQLEFLIVGLALSAISIPMAYSLLFHWRSKWTWFMFVMLMFFGNQAGLVGNVVHNNPWFKVNPYTGETTWAMSGLMRQYRFEGIFGGSMVILGGTALTAISVLVPRIKNAFVAQCAFIFFLFVTVMSMSQYTQLYCLFKNPSYPFRYYVPVPWATLRAWWLVTLRDIGQMLS